VENGVRVERIAALHLGMIHPHVYIAPFPAARVQQLVREFQPEVVHIQDHHRLSRAALQEARRCRIPVIGTNHFLPENILPFLKNLPRLQRLVSIPLWKMLLLVFDRLDLATTPSRTAAAILRAQEIRVPVRAISNGVDTTVFRPQPTVDRAAVRRKYGLDPQRALFLYVGRLDGEKRLDVLLQAAARSPRRDFQLAIAGVGRDESMLQSRLEQSGLQGRAVLIGFVPPSELPSLYNSADVFVMPSPEELQSIATLEAMACGKPVLAADARALPELVRPGVNGYLFRPGDALDAAARLDQILEERDRWPAMGAAGCHYVQEHSLNNTLAAYEIHYRMASEKILLRGGAAARRKLLIDGES
jgi:glycosyltransferase involved in cell wall biosynthesis